MQVFGVSVVRNEADILRVNVRHHLALGIDRFLILDNGSTDGTVDVLRELSRDGRVQWTSHQGEFRQADLTTMLAREAFLRGADWVIPIDADEFWYASAGDFRQVLERSSAGALQVRVVNYVQRRDQLGRSTSALLTLTMRPPEAIGPVERIRELVETRQTAFVETAYPPKWISRASFALAIGQGNHLTTGIRGPREKTDDIVCLHAPLRARTVLEGKVERGRRVEEVVHYLELAWHIRRWRQLAEDDAAWLDREWRANSYAGDCLDVYGVPHRLTYDPTLRDVLTPWIDREVEADADGMPAQEAALPLVLGRQLGFEESEPVRRAFTQMRDIEGWLFEPEAGLLMATAAVALAQLEPHAVVEVGSYCGRSTVMLATAVQAVCPETKVYAVDPHEGEVTCGGGTATRYEPPSLSKFRENIAAAGLTDVVELIQKRSFEVAWQQPISLLFIGALHDYANVSRDFAHFSPWLVDGGYVIFDDYDLAFPGVVGFVDEILASGRYRKVQQLGRMIVLANEPSRVAGSNGQEYQSTTSSTPGTSMEDSRYRAVANAPATDLQAADEPLDAESNHLRERANRQERALATLWGVLSEETARREEMQTSLQAQLQAMAAGRDRLVGERDALIQDLQARLDDLQARFQATAVGHDQLVGERDAAILDLQGRLEGLQAQLQAAVAGRDQLVSERNALIVDLHARLEDLQTKLGTTQHALAQMQAARVWRLIALYERVRRWIIRLLGGTMP